MRWRKKNGQRECEERCGFDDQGTGLGAEALPGVLMVWSVFARVDVGDKAFCRNGPLDVLAP
jgi:hypothetical protein